MKLRILVAFVTLVSFAKAQTIVEAYSTKPKDKTQMMQLCLKLKNGKDSLVYCSKDSTCKEPEKAVVLHEAKKGDSTFVLILVQAFTKTKGLECLGGIERKLYFVSWHPASQQGKWKSKYINSCVKTITDMSKPPIEEWDKNSSLIINYHRGTGFYEMTYDPQKPELGLQATGKTE